MRSSRMAMTSGITGAVVTVAAGLLFALPASALPGDDSNCPEGAQKTCTQAPPQRCPEGTVPAPKQPAVGEGVTCSLDSLVRARAKADVLTHDELLKLCADVQVRNLVGVRVAVGNPHYDVITLDGRTCGHHPKPPKPCDCPTPPVVPPAPNPAPAPAPLPAAPAPVIVSNHLPVTH